MSGELLDSLTALERAAVRELDARLRARADSFHFAIETHDEGRVMSVADGILRVSGLPSARLDELLALEGGGVAMVFELHPESLGAVLLDEGAGVALEQRVRRTRKVASIPVGDALLGRVIDSLGQPLDQRAPPVAVATWPVERPAPGIVERDPVAQPLLTGVLMIDALFPIGRGQRQLIVGDSGTGKSTLALDAVMHQQRQGVRCVWVSIGQKASSVVSLIEALQRFGALDNTVVVVAAPGSPPGQRFLAPYAASSIAEYFRDRGEHALLVFDDLSAHAEAYRELSLLLHRPPGREAFPGDVFYLHSRLLERATQLAADLGGGSLTALPIIETRAGRIQDFIPTNLISITDGQLYLDAALFDRGIKPAIDVGLSVSRVGGKTQRPSMKSVAGRLRLDAARYAELEVYRRFGARIDESTRQELARGERIQELLKQVPGSMLDLGEQVGTLAALDEGLFDSEPVYRVRRVAVALRARLKEQAPDLLTAFEAGRLPTEGDRKRLASFMLDLADWSKERFQPSPEASERSG